MIDSPETMSEGLITATACSDGLEIPSERPGSQRLDAAALAALAVATLAGCGGGNGSGAEDKASPPKVGGEPGGGSSPPTVGQEPPRPVELVPRSDEDGVRFLLQAQFSASPEQVASVRAKGYRGWLQQELDAPRSPPTYGGAIDSAVWGQLIGASDAVRMRLAFALSEVFVVSANGMTEPANQLMTGYWDLLVDGVTANFRTLLEDITLNPAMGAYLNTKGNLKEDANGRQPDENYAREVMQLFTIGLTALNPDGSPKLDADGKPMANYTQDDIVNLARVFTGYNFNSALADWPRRPMIVNEANHSKLEAKFLGVTVPANTPSAAALKIALDALFQHPSVGPFIGRKLIQRLTTSNPSKAYVQRVSEAFANNGAGVRGDMRAVFSAILLDPEARDASGLSNPTYGRLREPIVRVVQWARTFGLTSPQNKWELGDLTERIGQSPLRAPTVFNFFTPDHVPSNSGAAARGLVAPEFQIIDESTIPDYQSYMVSRVSSPLETGSPPPAYTEEMRVVLDAQALVRRLNLLLASGQISAETLSVMVRALEQSALTAESAEAGKLNRIYAAVLMIMSAPEYLIQK
jgi:uncharacterized protein (DUF1800 family)